MNKAGIRHAGKKFVAAMLTISLIFLIIPAGNAGAANSTNKKAGKAYAKIISRYLETYKTVKKNASSIDVKERPNGDYGFYYNGKWLDGVNYWFIDAVQYGFTMEEPSDRYTAKVVYKIMDFNKDGTPELFIGLSPECLIYDVYTFDKGKPVQLMEGLGSRDASCTLCKNGIIANISSWSASSSKTTYHKIARSKRLTDIIALGQENGHYTKTENEKTTVINKKEYDRLERKYYNPLKITFYQADAKAIKNIKQGKFSYKNQKSWKN